MFFFNLNQNAQQGYIFLKVLLFTYGMKVNGHYFLIS